MDIPNFNIPKSIPIPTDGIIFVGGGAATGAGISATVGGMGLAAVGTAVAIPMVLTGAGIGLVLYGAYKLGQKLK